jgi:hypothetical protein
MTGLHRTTLTTSQKIQCAAESLARQDEHGAKSALSREFGISRPTVYAAGETANEVLREHFEGSSLDGSVVCVFRPKLITDSGANRSQIPVETDHRFRAKPISDSGGKLISFVAGTGIV